MMWTTHPDCFDACFAPHLLSRPARRHAASRQASKTLERKRPRAPQRLSRKYTPTPPEQQACLVFGASPRQGGVDTRPKKASQARARARPRACCCSTPPSILRLAINTVLTIHHAPPTQTTTQPSLPSPWVGRVRKGLVAAVKSLPPPPCPFSSCCPCCTSSSGTRP